jgi:multimeric flavodoxin WrbA
LEKLKQADGFVLGSPLYFKIPSRLTAFMERLVILAFFHDTRGCSEPHLLYNKPCGIIAVAADGDPELVAEMLHRFVLSLRMKPMIKKTFPYLGVFSRGDISLDRNFSPLENSRELGEMLVMEMTKEK